MVKATDILPSSMRCAARLVFPLTALLLLAGCVNTDAAKIKELEKQNKVLTQYRDIVSRLDRSDVSSHWVETNTDGNREHCKTSADPIEKTGMGCLWRIYATALLQEWKGKATVAEAGRWGLVLEIGDNYADLEAKEGVEPFGEARFKAIRSMILDDSFRNAADPSKVIEHVRNYMYSSQKDFLDVLARTAAGEKTVLSKDVKDDGIRKEDASKHGSLVPEQAHSKEEAGSETVDAPKKQKWTYDQAMKEACDAGRQYREDVDLNGMRHSEAEYEAKAYSQHLANNSPAPRKALYDKIKQGLVMDACF